LFISKGRRYFVFVFTDAFPTRLSVEKANGSPPTRTSVGLKGGIYVITKMCSARTIVTPGAAAQAPAGGARANFLVDKKQIYLNKNYLK